MRYHLQYKHYKRAFKTPIRLGSHISNHREGILIQLTDEDGRVGYGEIAPLESFGSETITSAVRQLKSFCAVISKDAIAGINHGDFPCSSYALGCCLKQIDNSNREVNQATSGQNNSSVRVATLVQEGAFMNAEVLESGVAKLKIGSDPGSSEQAIVRVREFAKVCRDKGVKIRLDANEQLGYEDTVAWLDGLEPVADTIDFFEQPMDRMELESMVGIFSGSPFTLALDESVGTLLNFGIDVNEIKGCILVAKPSLGDLEILDKMGVAPNSIVLSSVFETALGFSELLKHQQSFERIPGFDTQSVFMDDLSYPKIGNEFSPNLVNIETIWQRVK